MWAAGVAVRPTLMASKWSSVLRQTDSSCGRVAAVALVGDDQVEGVDRDVELARRRRRSPRRRAPKTACAAEEVDRHALDRADVDEGVAGLAGRSGSASAGPSGRTSRPRRSPPLEPLASRPRRSCRTSARLRLERGEGPDRLGGQGAAVHQEQHPPGDARLHQPIDLVDHREGLAGAGRHRDEHLALAVGDRLLDRRRWPRSGRAAAAGDRSGVAASLSQAASKSRPSISAGRPGVWKPATWRERFSAWRTSWNQITSPLVEYRNGAPIAAEVEGSAGESTASSARPASGHSAGRA